MWTTAHQHFVKKNCKIVYVSNITFISNMAKEATNWKNMRDIFYSFIVVQQEGETTKI